jgi:hypothetical protein
MEGYKRLSIALILAVTIPMLIPGRTLQYYWLKYTRRWRSHMNGSQIRNTPNSENSSIGLSGYSTRKTL